MKRRTFIAGLGGTAAWPLAVRAQQSALPVIGFVDAGSADAGANNVATFRKGLGETGYVEGQNVTVEYHWLEGQFDRLAALMADLVVMPDGFVFVHRAAILSAAARNNVPTVYSLSVLARDGGLLSYGTDEVDTFRRAATYVDRILRGEKPAVLPVQFPAKYEMAVNLKTAKALGLTVPQSILLRADEVIE